MIKHQLMALANIDERVVIQVLPSGRGAPPAGRRRSCGSPCRLAWAPCNAGVPSDKAGLAAGLLNSSQQVGSALGLAVMSAVAISRTNNLIAAHASHLVASDAGYHQALLVGSILMAGAAVLALRIGNTRQAAPVVMVSAE